MLYSAKAWPSERMLARHLVLRPSARAVERAGRRIASSSAMMAMTTRSSMRVKPARGAQARGRLDVCMGPLPNALSEGDSTRPARGDEAAQTDPYIIWSRRRIAKPPLAGLLTSLHAEQLA